MEEQKNIEKKIITEVVTKVWDESKKPISLEKPSDGHLTADEYYAQVLVPKVSSGTPISRLSWQDQGRWVIGQNKYKIIDDTEFLKQFSQVIFANSWYGADSDGKEFDWKEDGKDLGKSIGNGIQSTLKLLKAYDPDDTSKPAFTIDHPESSYGVGAGQLLNNVALGAGLAQGGEYLTMKAIEKLEK